MSFAAVTYNESQVHKWHNEARSAKTRPSDSLFGHQRTRCRAKRYPTRSWMNHTFFDKWNQSDNAIRGYSWSIAWLWQHMTLEPWFPLPNFPFVEQGESTCYFSGSSMGSVRSAQRNPAMCGCFAIFTKIKSHKIPGDNKCICPAPKSMKKRAWYLCGCLCFAQGHDSQVCWTFSTNSGKKKCKLCA